jgi:hypothetical protein
MLCCIVLCCFWFLAVRISVRGYVIGGTIFDVKQYVELRDVTRVAGYTDT